MFRHLCGEDALSKVVLGTTNWGEVIEDVGQRREEQLAGFWKNLKGSTMMRFHQTQESARVFLEAILRESIRSPAKLSSAKLSKWQSRNRNKNRMIRQDDNLMRDPRDTDIVIPCASIHLPLPLLTDNFSIMGPTGVGKSTVCFS
jgi:flagellar biosynthesis GTPase FlhF